MTSQEDRDEADKPHSAAETREAEALRVALEAGDSSHEGVNVARALSFAMNPSVLSEAQHQAAFARAEWLTAKRARESRRTLTRRLIAATVTFSAAASIVLFVSNSQSPRRASSSAFGTSTQSLFSEPFSQDTSATTGRLGRIVEARSHAFRYQRYDEWGVR